MDDPTGGMWIYFLFFLIPAARFLPRLLRRIKGKNTVTEQQKFGAEPQKYEPEPRWKPKPKLKEQFFFEEKPPKKDDGWLNKDDFK